MTIQVKLADFDNSVVLDPCCPSIVDSATSCLPCSPTYAAPEVFVASRVDLAKADVFSLGITLFVMATGYAPWTQGAFRSIVLHLVSGASDTHCIRPTFPSRFSLPLQRLLEGMLAIDPSNRMGMDEIEGHQWLQDFASSWEEGRTSMDVLSAMRPQDVYV